MALNLTNYINFCTTKGLKASKFSSLQAYKTTTLEPIQKRQRNRRQAESNLQKQRNIL